VNRKNAKGLSTAKCRKESSLPAPETGIFKEVFLPHITSHHQNMNRLDIAWDKYLMNSLNRHQLEKRRGKGTRIRVPSSAPMPPNWRAFLREDNNKT